MNLHSLAPDSKISIPVICRCINSFNRVFPKINKRINNHYPDCCEITCVDMETGRYEFSVINNCFSFRVAKPYTRERKDAMRRYALENDTIAAVSGRKKEAANVTNK